MTHLFFSQPRIAWLNFQSNSRILEAKKTRLWRLCLLLKKKILVWKLCHELIHFEGKQSYSSVNSLSWNKLSLFLTNVTGKFSHNWKLIILSCDCEFLNFAIAINLHKFHFSQKLGTFLEEIFIKVSVLCSFQRDYD